jgi:hypothetical protein
MPDYNLHGLDPRTFQQLVQALAIREIASGVVVYGDGADGARDATFEGKMNYPSLTNPWDGYVVVQVKFQQKSNGNTQKDGAWACKHLKADLDKFVNNPSQYRVPEYYLFVTNVDLTAVPSTGTEAQVRKILNDYASKIGLRGYDIWDGTKIRRYIDTHRDIAKTYGGHTTTGDVLAKMQAHIDDLQPNFDQIISEYLQGELIADQYARLREAGSAAERRPSLARVFVDIPAAETPHSDPTEARSNPNSCDFVKQTLRAAALLMDRKSILARQANSGRAPGKATPEDGRIVLIGGPGQGKSTLSQFICQIYRAALLKDRTSDTLSESALDALEVFTKQCSQDNFELPSSRRFPVRIDLKNFADSLARKECRSIIEYISQKNRCTLRTTRRQELSPKMDIRVSLAVNTRRLG